MATSTIKKLADYGYHAITITGTIGDEIRSISAYTENGQVVVYGSLNAGLTNGVHSNISLGIPSSYLPRTYVCGTFNVNASADASNFFSVLYPSGLATFYIGKTLSQPLNFYFSYPLKAS